MSDTKPTPSEAARAEVEEWLDQWRPVLADLTVNDLIARITPVYERAQERDHLETLRRESHESFVEAERKGDEQRERAERAEVERDEARVKLLGYETDANASYAAGKSFMRGQLEPALHAAEADVKRLRDALEFILPVLDPDATLDRWQVEAAHGCAREALATTAKGEE